MNAIPFFKISGSGNDFIVINNVQFGFSHKELSLLASKLCRRRLAIGADGLIVLEESKILDFKCLFLNSNGSFINICGNGARCVAKYAHVNGFAGKSMVFETAGGNVPAEVIGDFVRIKLGQPREMRLSYSIKLGSLTLMLSSVNTGVPHAVVFVNNIDTIDVVNLGRSICHHNDFQPESINVNFVEISNDHSIFVRTYERGVEDETLACGTGNVAVAVICALYHKFEPPVLLTNRSGSKSEVHFEIDGDVFSNVYLNAGVSIIYRGILWKEW